MSKAVYSLVIIFSLLALNINLCLADVDTVDIIDAVETVDAVAGEAGGGGPDVGGGSILLDKADDSSAATGDAAAVGKLDGPGGDPDADGESGDGSGLIHKAIPVE